MKQPGAKPLLLYEMPILLGNTYPHSPNALASFQNDL